jgi:glycosyltransferase involved in cell wall biosynthesis
MNTDFDAILIGRNESARLPAAISAFLGKARRVIYVDSGSSDNSVALARSLGAGVVELDPARPFSASRARNEGFAALGPDPAPFVHFMDGDCIVHADWPRTALQFLADTPDAALVHGYSQEEAPDASIYNWMTHWEWQMKPGPAASGLGVFMIRTAIFAKTGGFRDSMIAAEDDELFYRVRAQGWQTWCIPEPMCRHDVNLHRFMPWFRRMIRAGHSFEELAFLHRGAALAQRVRAVFWAGFMPAVTVAAAMVWPVALLGVLGLYVASILRLALRLQREGLTPSRAAHAAVLLMASKFANLYGMGKYWLRRLRRSRAKIIEYR